MLSGSGRKEFQAELIAADGEGGRQGQDRSEPSMLLSRQTNQSMGYQRQKQKASPYLQIFSSEADKFSVDSTQVEDLSEPSFKFKRFLKRKENSWSFRPDQSRSRAKRTSAGTFLKQEDSAKRKSRHLVAFAIR